MTLDNTTTATSLATGSAADDPPVIMDEEAVVGSDNRKELTHAGASKLDMSADPFAPREGKTLTWKNINMTLVRTVVVQSLIACRCCIPARFSPIDLLSIYGY
jgi:hypothetical protein